MKLIIHAPNVHEGGGRSLLCTLLDALPEGHEYVLQADARLPLSPFPSNVCVIRVTPTLQGRYTAERRLVALASTEDAVLCMGNLPPLFELSARTYVLLQNRYLCERVRLSGFGPIARLRIAAERIWLRRRIHNVTRVIVQTGSMRDCVREAFGIEPLVLPFWREVLPERAALDRERGQSSRFLYVASPYPHKNHDRLFEAWRLLAAEGLRPELHVTLPTGCPAERTAARLREAGVRIVNHGEVDKKKLEDLYSSCHALVFPSVLESFGLPLLEARAAGLAIIAAERDYVRDTLDPDETFDPESALSIARAVKRYLRFVERRPEVVSAAEFARRILAGDL